MKGVRVGAPMVRNKVKMNVSLSNLTSTMTGRKKMNIVSYTNLNLLCPGKGNACPRGYVGKLGRGVQGTHTGAGNVVNMGIVITLSGCTSVIHATVRRGVSIMFSNTKLPLSLPSCLAPRDAAGLIPVMSSSQTTGVVYSG